ncbi:hypothetical protein SAMN06295967_11641 [Belliella buryatensis]|uniref:Uncharacterized protein n=1 Tax=Belliella buryatensis TaxID=1500549 RepID=A0A239GHI1_9BACT|nr:hypothetical protein [Belliella buryatensis]SNS68599.1 hypothetical protein SAMN06295967_11641 [Belliella buryatensis]
MKNFMKVFGFASILFIGVAFIAPSETNANPYKIVWQKCAPGSPTEKVIRCRLEGVDECFANWQTFCDEEPTIE